MSQSQTTLKELRQLIDKFTRIVDQQHQILVAARSDARHKAMQAGDELARLLVYVRRNLEDLERRVEAQEKEVASLVRLTGP